MAEILALDSLTAGYGESVVVDEVTASIAEGEAVALLGRNGMGKTTLLNTIMGFTRLHRGSVRFRGADVSRVASHVRARDGIGWVPQERLMWKSLTVNEHLTCVARPGIWNVRKVESLFPRLAERRSHLGSQLSGGEQQMLAIARALVLNPRVMLLDEPMEGLAPIVVQELAQVLRGLCGDGSLAMILVEQHAELALSITGRALVMERGRIVHDGPSSALANDRDALDRWLAVS